MAGEASYLNALPSALVAVDSALTVRFINYAAEILFGISAQQAVGRPLSSLPGSDADLCHLCERVFASSEEISLFEQTLRLPMKHRNVTMHLTPVIADIRPGEPVTVSQVLVTIERADGLDRQAASEWKQEATRVAGVMAAMLAHEVKNPLAGIRGAAQLLKDELSPEQQALTELICMETDRIRDLLAQVEVFAAGAPDHKQPVNIHEVLQYVIAIAQAGFASHVTFKELYDPSLPLVAGHRDMLVQILLNLVKNSAEALSGKPDATITLATTYRSGYRIRPKQAEGQPQEELVPLPVMVTVEDNGSGIPGHMRARLFEPFVSSKDEGRGLGLAVVAKLASDLGAVVELDHDFDKGARFMVWLGCVA
jgi:two-component system, NtrC family, nitrogen regulation sensor histidine kinase GlnL